METESTIGRHFHYLLPESVDDLLAAHRERGNFHARTHARTHDKDLSDDEGFLFSIRHSKNNRVFAKI